ncbi:hypothetical protein Taro_030238, partial [Colocasia esculenta]|nr:hypothetical protein [Colocasia esculenta]
NEAVRGLVGRVAASPPPMITSNNAALLLGVPVSFFLAAAAAGTGKKTTSTSYFPRRGCMGGPVLDRATGGSRGDSGGAACLRKADSENLHAPPHHSSSSNKALDRRVIGLGPFSPLFLASIFRSIFLARLVDR